MKKITGEYNREKNPPCLLLKAQKKFMLKADTKMLDWRYYKKYTGTLEGLEEKAIEIFKRRFAVDKRYHLLTNNCQHFA